MLISCEREISKYHRNPKFQRLDLFNLMTHLQFLATHPFPTITHDYAFYLSMIETDALQKSLTPISHSLTTLPGEQIYYSK